MVDWTLLALRILAALALVLFVGQIGLRVWRQSRRLASTGFALTPIEPASGRAQPLAAANTIGRAQDNTILLNDDFVSAHHATLVYRDGGWWLADLGSTNGTRLNGNSVSEPVQANPGDELQFGERRYRLERSA